MASNTGQPLYLLNEQDLATLRQLIEREKRRPQNQPGPPEALSEDNERSVVFAYIPVGGIPARADAAVGTSTGTGSGTAALNVGDYTLYGVECQMYREEWDDLVTTPTGSGTSSADTIRATARRVLKAVEGWTELVFNPNATVLAAGLIPTTISPWGSRVPLGSVGSAGHVVIRFKILSNSPFIGELSAYCATVLAEVLDVSCNGSGVNIGDQVVIWDPNGCNFNVPLDILIRMYGTAVKMSWGTPASGTGTGTGTTVPFPGRDGGISECVDNLGSGTGWVAGECWWMVQTLCCGEDLYY